MELLLKASEQQVACCSRLLQVHPGETLLLKALESAERAAQSCQKDGDYLQVAVQSYTQSVLDSTYFEETLLVNQAFSQASSFGTVVGIIDALSIPHKLGIAPKEVCSLLQDEIVECLYWRVGALLYMYCQTTLTRGTVQKEGIMECSCAGVGYLQLMLDVQPPLPPLREGEYTTNDPSLPGLLQQGIYSDVHMLALMYAGEMCYWHWELDNGGVGQEGPVPALTIGGAEGTGVVMAGVQADAGSGICSESESGSGAGHVDSGSALCPGASGSEALPFGLMGAMRGLDFVREWREEFNPVKLGVVYLTKYIDAARGPLKFQEWNYDRAIQLLIRMKKSQS